MSDDQPQLSEAAQRDFAPILEAFPHSTFDAQDHPLIRHHDSDVEGDPYWITFDVEGVVKLHTYQLPYLMLCPVALERLAGHGRKAAELYAQWRETESGKAWAEAD